MDFYQSPAKRTIWIFWCALLFVMAAALGPRPVVAAQDDLPSLIKEVEPSIVVVLTFDEKGRHLGQGTGFFISIDGDVITNHHVLEGASRAEIKTNEGKIYRAQKIVGDDKEGDLVRVSVDLRGNSVRPLSVNAAVPAVGERIFVIGSPLGLEQTVADGIISAIRKIPEFGNIVQLTAPISPGSSGSPVVNMKGEVIGVATFFLMAGQNLNFAIPGERIANLTTSGGKTLAEWEGTSKEEKVAQAEELYRQGLRLLWGDDCENAVLLFQEALKNDPHLAQAYFQIAYCTAKLGQHAKAIEPYQQVIQIKPDNAEAHNNLCVSYNMLGLYDKAVDACKEAIRIKPDFAEAYSNLGWAYQKLGRYTEGMDACREAIRIKPDHFTAHYNLGNNYAGLARYGDAAESYKQAIRMKPDYAEAHLNLGAAYFMLGRYPEAIDSYKEALRMKPALPDAHLNLGMTYLRVGDRGGALDQYRILKEQDQEKANRLFNLIYE